MQHNLTSTSKLAAALLFIMSLIAIPSPAEAQFLKKLGKGLEKVNQGINDVKKKADDLSKKKKKKDDVQPSGNQSAGTPSAASTAATTDDEPQLPPTIKKKEPGVFAHLTPDTRFILRNVSYNSLSEVSDGIFYLLGPNKSVDPYAHFFSFWTVDGKCLFPQQYSQIEGDNIYNRPRFDNGACVVLEGKKNNLTPVILYADGTTKPLSKDWTKVTQFVNGVAMVMEKAPNGDFKFFYINTKAQKIWPHLNDTYTVSESLKASKYAGVRIRPLRDNRRAFFNISTKKWGFLDEKGNIVIPAQYSDVRSFANGYALVIKQLPDYKYYNAFIDRNGKETVLLSTNASSVQYTSQISDISNNIYSITNGLTTTYYDLQNNVLKVIAGGGTGFHHGRAFAKLEKGADIVHVLNSDFIPIGTVQGDTHQLVMDRVSFASFPWYTIGEKTAVNYDGICEVRVPNSWEYSCYLGQYSDDGFATVQIECPDPNGGKNLKYVGYVDTDGKIRSVFSPQPTARGPFENLPGPNPPGKLPRLSPQPIWLSSGDTIPQGPVGPGREALKYQVNVVAAPTEGGTVYGSGQYSLGDTIRVTGTPAKGFRISQITCDRSSAYTSTFNKFVVQGDMTITCHFVKKDTVTPAGTFTLEGNMPQSGGLSKAFLMTGSVPGNRFPDGSNGVLCILTVDGNSPELATSANNQYAGSSAKIFFVPINVLGFMEENGKKYMRFDGGVIQYSLSVSDNTALGILNNPLLKLMMAFDGADRGELLPGSYRVEITAGAPHEGSMTLGYMQRKSPMYGWISTDDPSFYKRIPGFFIKRVDKGLGADYLLGTKLSATKPITIQWEPSEGFFADPSRLQEFARNLGILYRKTVKDTPLEDYDMRQFSSDLDNHIFKPK